MREFAPYHWAWLSAHPERSEEWLRRHMRDGFDIHHVDGDKQNNSPNNLVLIDGADHLMLHNGHRKMLRLSTAEKKAAKTNKKKPAPLPLDTAEGLAQRFGVTADDARQWQVAAAARREYSGRKTAR